MKQDISTGASSAGDRRQKDSSAIQARWDVDITFFYIWITTGWQK